MSLALRIGCSWFKRNTLLEVVNKNQRTFVTTALLGKRKDECSEEKPPKCAPENLAKNPCMQDKKKEKEKDKKPSFKSMWENPECCKDPCPEAFPRFDDLYYKISDKAKRKYTQTWNECPERRIVPKKICEYEKIMYPKLEKRPRKSRPKTAGSAECGDVNLMKCVTKSSAKCARITLPGCKAPRNPPHCVYYPDPSDCKKICAPYPAFSECQRDPPKPRRPVECHCLEQVAMCDVINELKKQARSKK